MVKKPIQKLGRGFKLPSHIHHRLHLHYLSNSFSSNPTPPPPTLLPSPIFPNEKLAGKRPAEEEPNERPAKKAKHGLASHFDTEADDEESDSDSADTPSESEEETKPAAVPTSSPAPNRLNFNLTAKQAGYVYNPRKSMLDLTSRFASPSDSENSNDSESDSPDTPSSKRRALTPVVAPTPVARPIRKPGPYNFNLTAKQAGYVYNPRKSIIDLTSRFASPSDTESGDNNNTDDSESDFNSTPNITPSSNKPRSALASVSSSSSSRQSPLPLPLPQWRYHHIPTDRNNPKTPPSTGTKRKMEQAYAEWRQAEMNAPRAPSYSPITLPSDTPQVREIDQVNQVNHAPAQYNQQPQQQNSPLIIPSSHQIHQPSTSSSSIEFPTNLPSPSVPIRLEPHSPVLDYLTAEYIAQGPHPNLQHVNHAVVDQVNASETLSRHLADRMPFVHSATRRLQAVVGVRNDLPFDLLMGSGERDAENLVVGSEGELVDLGLRSVGVGDGVSEEGLGLRADADRDGNGESLDTVAKNGDGVARNQEYMEVNTNPNINTNINASTQQPPNTTSHHLPSIHTPFNTHPSSSTNPSSSIHYHNPPTNNEFYNPNPTHFFPSSVNPHTGEGLRDYLLTRAAITGSKKRECRSISFHDFTPDVRTGEFRNQLLVHFGVDGISRSERVEVVELSL